MTAASIRPLLGAQPNPFYTVSGAVLGTALVCAVLLWAFTYPLPNIPAQFMQLSLVVASVSPSRHVRAPIPKPVTRAVTAKPLVMPETSPVKLVSPSVPLDISLPGSVFAPPAASAFVPRAFNPYSDLSKALAAPPPPAMIHNGDAYRSAYGFPVVKSGGRCLELQTVQVGLSPSAHTTVGFGVPCLGEYRPSMADELKAWADKQAVKNPRPP